MGRVLTQKQIRNLLITNPSPGPQPRPVWPRSEDRVLLHEACINKKRTITFTNGKKFNIRYTKAKSIVWGEYDVCYVSPVIGVAPCGWFHINFLLNKEE